MSVLKLRRDMVVVEEGPSKPSENESDKPFPLRRIEAEPADVIEGELVLPEAEEPEAEHVHHRTFFQSVGFWLKSTAIVAVLGAYPTMVVLASDVGDRDLSSLVDRSQWAAPWAGGAASLMQLHFEQLGWASDAEAWEPMARLTAKPAYQEAMAQGLGAVIALANAQAVAEGRPDADLEAAALLVSGGSSGDELRAARDALVNYDRRLQRRDAEGASSSGMLAGQLGLMSEWTAQGQAAIVASSASIGGSPMDEDATRAIYAAKGRAVVAVIMLEALDWPTTTSAVSARAEAIAAWKAVAEFHPLVVLNGDPDGSVFGNHPAAVGFLLTQAEAATAALKAELPAAQKAVAAPAVPAATAVASE